MDDACGDEVGSTQREVDARCTAQQEILPYQTHNTKTSVHRLSRFLPGESVHSPEPSQVLSAGACALAPLGSHPALDSARLST